MTSFLSGAGFGAALVAAGMSHPSTVISQLKWQEWHMLQVFITATASSAAVYTILEKTGYVTLKPRSTSPIGLFSKYDGNIIGGALLGAGMALSGSCPGTGLAQVGAGISTGAYVWGGCILGGIIYTGLVAKPIKSRNDKLGVREESSTLGDNLGVSRNAAFVIFEIACIAALVGTTVYGSKNPAATATAIKGGLLIGSAQLFSILIRKAMLGVSGSYSEIGNYFWWLVGGASSGSTPKSYGNILFASGTAAGAYAIANLFPSTVPLVGYEASPILAVVGGVTMVVGARIAGGCTSGHGISGMSLLSMSSIITIASTFIAGAVVAASAH